MPQLYQLTIRAEGELRDKDGNLISDEPLSGQAVVTEEQAAQIREALAREPREDES